MENQEGYFSRKLRAGKKRSYFFDVRATKQGDYFITITESKRRHDKPGYDSHKIYLYKEDFKAFKENFEETLNHIKTELNPEFDYDNYDRSVYVSQNGGEDDEHDDKPKHNSTKSDMRTGSYLDQYEGKDAIDYNKEDTETPSQNDEDVMQW